MKELKSLWSGSPRLSKERLKKSFYSKGIFKGLVALSVILFFVSLIPFVVKSFQRQEFILIYPDKEDTVLFQESRVVPRGKGARESVKELVLQVIQGSKLLEPTALFPYDTRVNQVFVTQDEVYIDLSAEAMDCVLPIERATELLKENIRKNFSNYETIMVTVNGNDPVVVNKSLEEKDSEQ